MEPSFNSADFLAYIALLVLFFYVLFSVEIRQLQRAFIAFHIGMLMWPFGMFLISTTDNALYQWGYLNLAFAGLSFLGYGWLIFSLILTAGFHKVSSKQYWLLGLPAAAACILITLNPLHGLFVQTQNGWYADRTYGPVFFYLVIISIIYILLGSFLMLRALQHTTNVQFRKQILLFLLGQVFMLGFALLDTWTSVLHKWPLFAGLEGLTSFGILLSDICFVIAIRKHNAFLVISVALREVVDSMDTGMVILDYYHNVIDRNAVASRYFAVKLGQPFPIEKLMDQALEPGFGKSFLEAYFYEPEKLLQTEVIVRNGGGSVHPTHVSVRLSPVYLDGGVYAGRIITMQDVTEWRGLLHELHESNEHLMHQNSELTLMQQELSNANRMLEQMATTDSLTGCFNRRYMFQMLEYQIAVEQRYQVPFSLLMFDVDHFKNINDTYGHHTGDEVLRQLTSLIRVRLRESDIFSRYGGEEFTVYLPHTESQDALRVAEQLRQIVEGHVISTEQGDIRITISIGLISVPRSSYIGENPKQFLLEVIRRADSALYEAKKQGRNCVIIA